MDIQDFEKLARAHLYKLIIIFISCLFLAIICYSISDWAYSRLGWQSEIVGFIFYALTWVLGFGVFMSITSIYGWCKNYHVAKSDAAHFDIEKLQKFRSDVVGPIQWK